MGSTFYLPYGEGPGGKEVHDNLLSLFSYRFMIAPTQTVICS